MSFAWAAERWVSRWLGIAYAIFSGPGSVVRTGIGADWQRFVNSKTNSEHVQQAKAKLAIERAVGSRAQIHPIQVR